MAPKKAAEKVQEEGEPVEAPPSGFSDESGGIKYIDDLLKKFAPPGDIEGIVRGIADSDELTKQGCNDYKVNLRSSILVDFWFTNLSFAQQRRWSAEKTQQFLFKMEDLRLAAVRDECGVGDAKLLLKRCLLQWQDDSRKAQEAARREAALAAAKGDKTDDDSATGQTPRDTGGKAPAKPAPKPAKGGGKDPKGAPSAAAVEEPKPEPKKKDPCLNVFSIDDLAGIAEHCQRGLFQHARLWHRTFTAPRQGGRTERAKLVVWVEEPAVPPRLSLADGPFATTAAAAVASPSAGAEPGATAADPVVVPTRSKRAQQVADEQGALVRRRLAEEARSREEAAARRAAEEAETARRRQEEEDERTNQLVLGDRDKQQAVEAVQQKVRNELTKRQERLKERLAALEEKLAADADDAPPAGKK